MAFELTAEKPIGLNQAAKKSGKRRTRPRPGMLRGKDAAFWASVSLRTWRSWDAGGLVPRPLRIGGCTLWNLRELRAWRDAGCPPRDEWEVLKQGA
jgi:hypothetical protein